MASASHPHTATTPPGSPLSGDETRPEKAPPDLRWGRLHLVSAKPDLAASYTRSLGRRLSAHHVIETAYNLQASLDPAQSLRYALRESMVYETKQIARVFCGRIVKIQPRENAHPGATVRHEETPGTTPLSSHLEVHLETQEDERILHLEGAWAWNLHTAQAEVGDIVQIDRKSPLVTVKNDPSLLDARVLDERVHWIRLSLGSLDRAHQDLLDRAASPKQDATTGEIPAPAAETDDDLTLKAAASLATIFATGERVPTSPRSRVMTDRWLRKRLQDKKARLEAGVLLITQASMIPAAAMAALHAAMLTPDAPAVLLGEPAGEAWDALVRAHPDAPQLQASRV